MSNVNFENRTVIVTGAGNGLGKAYALELGSRGAKVVVNDLGGSVDGSGSASSPADDVVNEIIKNGGEAIANYDSVATKEGGESIVQSALDNFGTVDAVINNAGILRDKSFANMSEDELSLILDVHLKGTFFVSQPAFKVMKENNYGRIVNVASPSGLFGNFGQSNYGAAKMGIVGLTNVLSIEGAKYNIKVNVIAPTAYTRMTEALLPEDVGKLFSAELVTPMVVYLASEACEPTHEIFGVAAGRFARIGIITHNGYVNTSATAEDISENIEEIRTIKDGTYPLSNEDELMIIQKAIQGS
ncbi:MAG: SDR family oxidoreductase [Candidatus Actinomarina sp.]|jgi:NAD(P)-dependent dehydrogenase (short-subunit alcohol dehydrogenase family)|nr:SDR family oxidoreductase [Candidatus Actinomarina sp.]NND23868.1 SDR family oxidoreductase [Acidimicrobiia bacterium]OUX06084.1 MAG: short-chain dehydrogenase [Acidimicrobiaceae bacterium TMED244]|tara:strand:+ start:8241 stop:9143 length:903 start_codon:yes stop_codon:yes gene_type:complete